MCKYIEGIKKRWVLINSGQFKSDDSIENSKKNAFCLWITANWQEDFNIWITWKYQRYTQFKFDSVFSQLRLKSAVEQNQM